MDESSESRSGDKSGDGDIEGYYVSSTSIHSERSEEKCTRMKYTNNWILLM